MNQAKRVSRLNRSEVVELTEQADSIYRSSICFFMTVIVGALCENATSAYAS